VLGGTFASAGANVNNTVEIPDQDSQQTITILAVLRLRLRSSRAVDTLGHKKKFCVVSIADCFIHMWVANHPHNPSFRLDVLLSFSIRLQAALPWWVVVDGGHIARSHLLHPKQLTTGSSQGIPAQLGPVCHWSSSQ